MRAISIKRSFLFGFAILNYMSRNCYFDCEIFTILVENIKKKYISNHPEAL